MDAAEDYMVPVYGGDDGGEAAACENYSCGPSGYSGVGDVYCYVDAGGSDGWGAADIAVGYGGDAVSVS